MRDLAVTQETEGPVFVGITAGRCFHRLVTVPLRRGVTYEKGACGATIWRRVLIGNIGKKKPCRHCWPSGVEAR